MTTATAPESGTKDQAAEAHDSPNIVYIRKLLPKQINRKYGPGEVCGMRMTNDDEGLLVEVETEENLHVYRWRKVNTEYYNWVCVENTELPED